VPGRGESVLIGPGHAVAYDIYSDVEVGRLQIQGSLIFARNRHTRLDVGNVIVDRGGTLDMGNPADPIPVTARAELQLVIQSGAACTGGSGFIESDTGVWVYGRWNVHGAPVRVTWTKATAPVSAGASSLQVADDVTDWQPGAWIVVTPTAMGNSGTIRDRSQYEERQIRQVIRRAASTEILLDRAVLFGHDAAADTVAEVALLTRNVVVASKYPGQTMQGHTMYLSGASGGIGYAEFRDLGNFGCLGRYPVHFHLMADTSYGMRVHGASIWRSDNNFLNIHASNGITVEDTVGYRTAGVGFFVGEPQSGMHSVDNVMIGNFAARVVYREGALRSPADSRHRAAGYWIHSTNTVLIGNVATGALGVSVNDSGFHVAEQAAFTPGFSALQMVRNEAHSNNGSGLHTWLNLGPQFHVVDFRAWRNGYAGIKWGAYGNNMRVHRALLFENGTYNLQTTAIGIYLTDSRLLGTTQFPTRTGLFIDGYSIANDPRRPAAVYRTSFAGHEVDVSQNHDACASSAEETNSLSRTCSASFYTFTDVWFGAARPFEFSWHRNAHSWFSVSNYAGSVSLPASFRLTRRDQPRPNSSSFYHASADAWLNPASGPVAEAVAPPLARLAGPVDGALLGAAVTLQVNVVSSAAGVARVVYYVDEQAVATQTSSPFSYTWSSGGWTRRWAHVYAAVVDNNGNTGFTQVVRLQRNATAPAPIPTPSVTPVRTPTATPRPTATPAPQSTATPTPRSTGTATPRPTATPSPTPTPVRTITPAPTPTHTPKGSGR